VFTRFTTEGALYRTLRPRWVLAASLRLGNFFQTVSTDPGRSASDFLPPEERFYAGGATTVRGYGRNELGPLAYITDKVTTDSATGEIRPENEPPTSVPLGGTSFGVANAELRFPSPLFSRQVRLAAFVDAGAIRSGNIWEMVSSDWHFTPGVGIRIATPVGPARVDAAFNPYDPVRGVLFLADSARIVPIRSDYAPPRPNFFGRWRIHVAIGQAF
jgi:outer membrane protein insertion porin family